MADKEFINMNEITFQGETIPETKTGRSKPIETNDSDFSKIDPALFGEYNDKVDILMKYLALTEDATVLGNEKERVLLFARLSFGLRKAGEALSWITYHQKVAYAQRKEAEGIAAIDEYTSYLEQKRSEGKTERATNEMRNYYVNTSGNVMKANKKEAMVNAMYEHLSTIKYQFVQSISTLRAIHYSSKDSSMMSSASVNTDLSND